MPSPRHLAITCLILFVYFGLGLTTTVTKAPWCDEGWFGNPAYNLAYRGFMGTTVLEPASSTWKSVKLTGIDRHTYWVMPLSLLTNAAAFRVFGFSVLPMRLLSLFWGVLVLLAWFTIVSKLTGSVSLALGAAGLIAIDFHFLAQAADGRMDVMTVALGWSGVAVYLLLRERRFAVAVLVSQTLAAMAFFTHPNGIMLVLILACTTLYLDRKLVRVSTVAVAAVPYLVLAAGWALYILQAPNDFVAQFLGNASGRGPTITAPLAALKAEIVTRYLASYGMASWSSLAGRLNIIPLLVFIGGVVVYVTSGLNRLLLIWTAIVAVFLAEFEGLKTWFYLVYLTPLLSAILAMSVAVLWKRRPQWRIPITAVLAVFCLLQTSRTVLTDVRHSRKKDFDPAVEYVRAHFTPRTFIMGGAELMFGLGPNWNLLDDIRLGYNTGKVPDVIVIAPEWQDRIQMLETVDPRVSRFVTERLQREYREVFNNEGYRILTHAPINR